MSNKAIPIELKFDENVLQNAKALGRLQGIVFTLLFLKVCKAIVKTKQEKSEQNEES